MDHETLLAKYIEYVGEMEGTDYLGFDCAPAPFTEAEWDELRRLAASDDDNMQRLPGCPSEGGEPLPCDQLYRLVSMEEDEDGVVTMVLERAGEDDA